MFSLVFATTPPWKLLETSAEHQNLHFRTSRQGEFKEITTLFLGLICWNLQWLHILSYFLSKLIPPESPSCATDPEAGYYGGPGYGIETQIRRKVSVPGCWKFELLHPNIYIYIYILFLFVFTHFWLIWLLMMYRYNAWYLPASNANQQEQPEKHETWCRNMQHRNMVMTQKSSTLIVCNMNQIWGGMPASYLCLLVASPKSSSDTVKWWV